MNRIHWDNIEKILKNVRTALLYGPPGTSKTTMAHKTAKLLGIPSYSLTLADDISSQEIIGHWVPKANGAFDWHYGPAMMAWNGPGMLVLNEINKASGSVLVELYSVLDDASVANKTLSSGEILSPRDGFRCIATMNGEPDELPDALLERFEVAVEVTEPHPAALGRIQTHSLREMVQNSYKDPGPDGITYRQAMAYQKLIGQGVDSETATFVIFGKKGEAVTAALAIGTRPEEKS